MSNLRLVSCSDRLKFQKWTSFHDISSYRDIKLFSHVVAALLLWLLLWVLLFPCFDSLFCCLCTSLALVLCFLFRFRFLCSLSLSSLHILCFSFVLYFFRFIAFSSCKTLVSVIYRALDLIACLLFCWDNYKYVTDCAACGDRANKLIRPLHHFQNSSSENDVRNLAGRKVPCN